MRLSHIPRMNPLRAYLADAGVTQVRFAEMIGVKQSMVSRLLSGAALPSLQTAVKIERKTGGAVPASAWVPETGADPASPAAAPQPAGARRSQPAGVNAEGAA